MGVVGKTVDKMEEVGAKPAAAMSVCTVSCVVVNFDGKEAFRVGTGPFAPAELGRGGRSVGDNRPPTSDGRRPGCDDDRVRPIFALDLGTGIDPADAMESAGDEDRGVGGAEVLALRWMMVP